MSTTDTKRQLNAEYLSRARTMTQHILRDWGLIRWDDLPANDVVLSVRMGSIDIDQVGDLAAIGGNLQVSGRADAKRILKGVYGGGGNFTTKRDLQSRNDVRSR